MLSNLPFHLNKVTHFMTKSESTDQFSNIYQKAQLGSQLINSINPKSRSANENGIKEAKINIILLLNQEKKNLSDDTIRDVGLNSSPHLNWLGY